APGQAIGVSESIGGDCNGGCEKSLSTSRVVKIDAVRQRFAEIRRQAAASGKLTKAPAPGSAPTTDGGRDEERGTGRSGR
ncbi:MAG TPA: hypothetical protein VFQ80_04035, partial [Thermomicrobiales bacterium]|nr:hypothetical protein [Thermomicrobiales bacterium]